DLGGDRVELLPGFGQPQRAVASLEKRQTELVLELLDLAADRRLGEIELLARLGERQVARRRFEADQQVESRHCITFCHARPEYLPFECTAARMQPAHVKRKEKRHETGTEGG